MFNINKQILMRKPYSTMCVRLEVNGVKIYIEITCKTIKWKCQFAFTHQVFEFETNSIDKNFTFFFDTIYKFILLCKRLTQIEKTIVTTGPLVKLFVCQNLLGPGRCRSICPPLDHPDTGWPSPACRRSSACSCTCTGSDSPRRSRGAYINPRSGGLRQSRWRRGPNNWSVDKLANQILLQLYQ